MPRDIGTGLYTYPSGTEGNTAQTIFSARYNTFINDLANTLNQALPVNMGGTGADNATEARDNLDVEVSRQEVTNYDDHVWEAGSFYSAIGATSAPVAGHGFAGISVVYGEPPAADYITLAARDLHDTVVPGRVWVREKKLGVWGPWAISDYLNASGDEMTGNLTISKTDAQVILRKPASGSSTGVSGYTGSNPRWILYLGDDTAETGSNAGSNFLLRGYRDDISNFPALQINRATQAVTVTGQITGLNNVQIGGSVGAGLYTDGAGIGLRAFGTNPIYFQSGTGAANYASFSPTGLAMNSKAISGVTTLTTSNNITAAGTVACAAVVFNSGGLSVINASTTSDVAIKDGAGAITYANFSSTLTNLNSLRLNASMAIPAHAGSLQIGSDGSRSSIVTRASVDGVSTVVFDNAAGAVVGSIFQSVAGVAYNTTSDERLKEDLKSFDAGNIIDDTNVYDFAWKSTGERSFGVIGQQAIEVYPTAVTYAKEMDWYGVDYSKYVPVILQELKTLRVRVAELEGLLVDFVTKAKPP